MGKDVEKLSPAALWYNCRATREQHAISDGHCYYIEKVSNKITSRQYTGSLKSGRPVVTMMPITVVWLDVQMRSWRRAKLLFASTGMFHKSAECNNSSGWYNLDMYRDGYGTAQDLQQALYWFKKQCSRGVERRRDPQTGSPTARLTWRTQQPSAHDNEPYGSNGLRWN